MESDGLAGSLIILAVILFNGFFTACEAAVTEINDSKVRSFENESGNRKCLYNILQKPSRLISSFALNKIFCVALISYLSLFYFLNPLSNNINSLLNVVIYNGADKLSDKGAMLSTVVSLLIIMILSVLVMLIFGDGLPRRMINQSNSEYFAVFCAPAVKYLIAFLAPVTAVSCISISLFSKIFGIAGNADRDVVTEEEIMMMVDAGNETGVIEQSQREMISNIFEFDELSASDIMTHRTDIVSVDVNTCIPEVVNVSIGSGFSRIPVYKDNIDHIIGIICVKDLLCLVGSDAAASALAKSFVREVIYIPETLPCKEAFKRLTAKKMQLAVIVDEYGGTAGILTMEDLVESIVGNIQDEYDDEDEAILKISDDTYIIDGTAEPEDILEQLGIILPQDNDFDTISGFIVNLLGRIPNEDENPIVNYEGVKFTVLITEDMCITKVKAKLEKNDKKEIETNEEKA